MWKYSALVMFGQRRKRSIERLAMERILLRGKGTLILFLIKYVPGWNPCKPYAEDAPVVVKCHAKVTNDAKLYLPTS